MLDTDGLKEAVDAIDIPAGDTREERIQAWHERRDVTGSLEREWAWWLASTYLPGVASVVADAVFAKAWDDGHAEGYYSVESHYEDLSDLVMFALKNGRVDV
jgi:hypothetical protein